MIKCTITIRTVKKGYYIDVNPDQSNGTEEEMHAASCINVALP